MSTFKPFDVVGIKMSENNYTEVGIVEGDDTIGYIVYVPSRGIGVFYWPVKLLTRITS